MSSLPEQIRQALEVLQADLPAFMGGVAVSVAALLGVWLLRWLALRTVSRRTDDAVVLYRWRKFSNYLAAATLLLLLVLIWFERLRLALALVGLLSAGVAIALSGLIAAVAGWFFILLRRPFEVGDRIQVGEHAGDVIDIRLFKFSLMEIGNWVDADQSTGRVIHVPNGKVLTEAVVNYTRGFHYIWNEIPVRITFESDWQKAKEILQDIADRHVGESTEHARQALKRATRRFLLYYSRLTPIVYTKVDDSGVVLTVRHLTEPRSRRGATQAIWEDVLRAFHEAPDIELAYPTRRFYVHPREGKPALRPAPPDEP